VVYFLTADGEASLDKLDGVATVTHLVERGDKAGVVVEGGHDQGVVLLVDVQGGLHVHLGVLDR